MVFITKISLLSNGNCLQGDQNLKHTHTHKHFLSLSFFLSLSLSLSLSVRFISIFYEKLKQAENGEAPLGCGNFSDTGVMHIT